MILFATGNATGKTGSLEKWGSVHLPISCPESTQKSFDKGLALLHSFEYDASEREFRHTLDLDPHCPMAYWGIAMTRNHQLWLETSKDDLSVAKAALAKAVAMHPTGRDLAFIVALQAFYFDDASQYLSRMKAYSLAMKKLRDAYPGDIEAGTFYALSLLSIALLQNDVVGRKKAGAILEQLFARDPQHPGIAHYLIHCYDTPELAPLGLKAARQYAKIAPSSPHALHMPSHIFVQLGLFQDSISSNVASFRASERTGQAGQKRYSEQLHAIDFIIHSALQVGQASLARRYLSKAQHLPLTDRISRIQIGILFPSDIALETHDWKAAMALPVRDSWGPDAKAILYRVKTIGAARAGELAAALQNFYALQSVTAEMEKSSDPRLHGFARSSKALNAEAAAWISFIEDHKEDAVKELEPALHRDQINGPGFSIPAAEMLGDMLLSWNRNSEALAAYQHSLAEAPGRFNSLYGAARAAELSGDVTVATHFYRQLVASCKGGHHPRTELNYAIQFIRKLSHRQGM